MDVKAMQTFITQIALIFGGWATIVTALAIWISQLVTKRLFNTWDKKSQIEIEKLHHIQTESQLVLNQLVSAISSNQTLIQTRRIEATDKLWSSILKLKENFNLVIYFFVILLPGEYQLALSKKNFSKLTALSLEGINELTKIDDLENYRPYFGETLWLYFFTFRAILGRSGWLIVRLTEGEKINDWWQDSGIQANLKAILTEDELDAVEKAKNQKIILALNFIESKLLKEIYNILSGHQSSLENLQNSIELQKQLTKSQFE